MDLTMRFFTSDTHLGHANINSFAGRPFESVSHADEMLIQRWNSVVRPGDYVYHLGDVALGQLDVSLPKLARMNGHKILIPGNHDRVFSGNRDEYRQRFWPVYSKYFSGIWPEQIKVMLTRSGKVVRLCHFPRADYTDPHETRYMELRAPNDDIPLLHGHLHVKEKVTGPLSFHVGVDAHDFTPVSEEEIEAWVETL